MSEVFLQHRSVQPRPGATAEQIVAVESAAKLTLPDEVKAFYAASDGATVADGASKILSLAEALELAQGMASFGIPKRWRYFPLTDASDSNPYCVCCREPVQGWIAHVYHDDVATLQFRSFAGFLDALVTTLDGDEPRLDELLHDFSGSKRKKSDIATGNQLLALTKTGELGEVARADALRWSATLMGENQLDVLAKMLEEEDEYTRSDVVDQLRAMDTPAARELMERYRAEMRDFVTRCVEGLREAGIIVAQKEGDYGVRLGGRCSLNMPMMYTRRRSPTFMADLVKRAKEFLGPAYCEEFGIPP